MSKVGAEVRACAATFNVMAADHFWQGASRKLRA